MSRSTSVPELPVPSEADRDVEPGVYDEPALPSFPDRVPQGSFRPGSSSSPADIRLQAERLLARRDSIEDDAWSELEGVGRILSRLLDDASLRRDPAAYTRLIAVIGQRREPSAVPLLIDLVTSPREPLAVRWQAVNALGWIGDAAALDALALAAADSDAALRRQAAFALSRLGTGDAIPYVRELSGDESTAVSEVARAAISGERYTVHVDGSGHPQIDDDTGQTSRSKR